MRLRFIAAVVAVLAACSSGEETVIEHPMGLHTFAERFADAQGRMPINYADPKNWECTAERKDDVCDHDFTMARLETDGTVGVTPYAEAAHPPVDCFYIYPTLDFDMFHGATHENMNTVDLPRRVIEGQAGPFSQVCRVFAPYYRQGNFGAYETNLDFSVWLFKNAFVDVAASFEYYLRHWNQGRPVVLIGHSQGAQHVSYLLHTYFDGDRQVTDIPGSETTAELRKRLVLGLPVGFQVFVPKGKLVGGSFSDISLCSDDHTPGCVIHYRSFTEGYKFKFDWGDDSLDEQMARAGLLNRPMEPAKDEIACVNPGLVDLGGGRATDVDRHPIASGDTRILLGTSAVGVFALLQVGAQIQPPAHHYPGRYTATCRLDPVGSNYLAIGYHEPVTGVDQRGDPFNIDGPLVMGDFGLHIFDFNLPQGELIEHVRRRSVR